MDLSRTELLIGKNNLEMLKDAAVALFGLGGVGGYALEALVRGGIGRIHIYDYDTIASSNLNRQILTLETNIGQMKLDAAIERTRAINRDTELIPHPERITPENIAGLVPADIDYAIDAIDEVPSKIALIAALYKRETPLVSCMGAGRKLSPEGILIDDIKNTEYCPLARKVRKGLKKENITSGVTVVYSKERGTRDMGESDSPIENSNSRSQERAPFGSISYIPGLFGLTAAGIVIEGLIKREKRNTR